MIRPQNRGLDAPSPKFVMQVQKAWTESLTVSQLNPKQNWEEAGADSMMTMHLLLKLEKICGQKLSFDILTPEMTADSLVAKLQAYRPLELDNEVPTVFLLPGVFGDEPILASFRRSFAQHIRFEVIDLPEIGEPKALLASLHKTGEFAAREIMWRQAKSDIFLAGFSFGGSVALEAARHLVASGRRVAFLGLLDPPCDAGNWQSGAAFFQQLIAGYTKSFHRYSILAMLKMGLSDTGRRFMLAGIKQLIPGKLFWVHQTLLQYFRADALANWRPLPLDVPVFLYVSEEYAPFTAKKWQNFCPDIKILILPGNHRLILQQPALSILTPAFTETVLAKWTGKQAGKQDQTLKYRSGLIDMAEGVSVIMDNLHNQIN